MKELRAAISLFLFLLLGFHSSGAVALSNSVCITPALHKFDYLGNSEITVVGGFLHLSTNGNDVTFLRGISNEDSDLVLQEIRVNGTDFEIVNPEITLTDVNSLAGGKALHKILRDGAGDILLVGSYLVGIQRFMFVAKYTSTYSFVWIRTFVQPGPGSSRIVPLGADIVSSASDILVVGFTNHVFPGSAAAGDALTNTGFLLHLAENGTTLWISQETVMDTPFQQVVCRDSSICYLQSTVEEVGVLKRINMETKAVGLNLNFTSALKGNAATSLFLSPSVSNEGVGMAYVYTPNAAHSQLFVNFYYDNETLVSLADAVSLGIVSTSESGVTLAGVLSDPNDNLYVVGYTKFQFEKVPPLSPTNLGMIIKYNNTTPVYTVNVGDHLTSTYLFNAMINAENDLIISGSFEGNLFGEASTSMMDALLVRFTEDSLIYSESCSKSCNTSCPVSLTNPNITCDSGPGGRGLCVCPENYYGISCENFGVPTPSPNATSAPTPTGDLPGGDTLPLWAIVVIACSGGILLISILVLVYLFCRKRLKYSPRARSSKHDGDKYVATEVAIDSVTNQPVQKTFVQATKSQSSLRSGGSVNSMSTQVPVSAKRSEFEFPALPPTTSNYDSQNSPIARPDPRRVNASDKVPTYNQAMTPAGSSQAPAYDEIMI